MTPDPNLQADELKLATGIANLAKILAILFGKDKAKAFIEAVIIGASEFDDTQPATVGEAIDGALLLNLDIANIVNSPTYIVASTFVKNLYEDIEKGQGSLIADIHALIQTHKQLKAAKAAAATKAA